MSNDRKIDAAIGLLGLGKIYPHTFTDNNQQCSLCGNGAANEVICYSAVPNFGTSIEDASDLLAVLMKEAPDGIEVIHNKALDQFELVYKGKNTTDNYIVISKSAAEGIRKLAIYHFNIDINQVTDKVSFNLQV
jgi:hypothetical protein